jgi:hypothetical protein
MAEIIYEPDEKPETLEIFFTDLKPVIQQKYLDFLGIQSPSDGNLDCFPIAIVNKGQEL